MAARVIDAKFSMVIGTVADIKAFIAALGDGDKPGRGAAVIDLKHSHFVIAGEPLIRELIADALAKKKEQK